MFQGLRDEDYKPGDTLNVGPERWRVDRVEDPARRNGLAVARQPCFLARCIALCCSRTLSLGSLAAMPMLAGIPVKNESTLDLAELLADAGHDQTAAVLVLAIEHERRLVALTISDREPSWPCSTTRPPDSASCVACCCASTNGGFWKVSARPAIARRPRLRETS